MKTIGIIGGVSWVSSLDYYRIINETINSRLGGLQAGKIILYSLNYGDIKMHTDTGDWPMIARIMISAAGKLEAAGADCILLGANTMHRLADEIQQTIRIPLIHIARVVASELQRRQVKRVALLGTKFTMELDFYSSELAKGGITTVIPKAYERDFIHASIYNELGKGMFLPETKARYLEIIDNLASEGIEAVILGCTEIPMLIKQDDCVVPLLDTTALHCVAAVNYALQE
jgi:aspartate racemase